jgi:hypothetical protein
MGSKPNTSINCGIKLYIVTFPLRAGIVELEETAVATEGPVNHQPVRTGAVEHGS